MPGHYGTLIAGDRSRRYQRLHRSSAAAIFRYRTARETHCLRARRDSLPLASLIIKPRQAIVAR